MTDAAWALVFVSCAAGTFAPRLGFIIGVIVALSVLISRVFPA